MRSVQLLCVCSLVMASAASECDGDPSCAAEKDAASLLQSTVHVHDIASASNDASKSADVSIFGEANDIVCYKCMGVLEECMGTIVTDASKTPTDPKVLEKKCCGWNAAATSAQSDDYVASLQATGSLMGKVAAKTATGNCGGNSGPAVGTSYNYGSNTGYGVPTMLLQGDCVDPATSPPSKWACGCMEPMKAACKNAASQQACFKALMCKDGRIASVWKSSNCGSVSGATAGCGALLLVERSARETKSAHENNESVSSMDESLAGKRTTPCK